MPNIFFIGKAPPFPPPYHDIALLLSAIILIFTRPIYHAATSRFFTRKFYTVNGLNTLPNIVTERLIIRPNQHGSYRTKNTKLFQHGYLGSHAQQRRYLFYIYKSISSRSPPCCPFLKHIPLSSNNPYTEENYFR